MMNKIIKKMLLASGCLALFASCYDDLGNYDYREINDMVISDASVIGIPVPSKDSAEFVINPEIEQTQQKDSDNLRYEWKRQFGRDWKVVGNELSYRGWVHATDKDDILLRLAVTDINQDIITYKEYKVVLKFGNPYSWFLLQDINGQAVLGNVGGLKDGRLVDPDYYNRMTNQNLGGKPLFLSVNNHCFLSNPRTTDPKDFQWESQLGIYTEGGFNGVVTTVDMREKYLYPDMLIAKKKGGNSSYLPQFAAGGQYGECVIDGGQFWFACGYPVPHRAVYYPVKAADGLDVEAGMAFMDYQRLFIIWDKQNRRFLKYIKAEIDDPVRVEKIRADEGRIRLDGNLDLYDPDGRLNASRIEPIGDRKGFPNGFDPDHVSGDVIFMGPIAQNSQKDGPKEMNMLAVSRMGSSLTAYEFNLGVIRDNWDDGAYCQKSYSVPMQIPAGGSAEDIHIASSLGYTGMFFYSCGNTVYRVDLTRATPQVFRLCTFGEGESIVALKFCSQAGDGTEPGPSNDPRGEDTQALGFPKKLGLVLRSASGDEDTLVEMDLSNAGDVSLDEQQQVVCSKFSGFHNVVDIAFAFTLYGEPRQED